MCCTKGPVLYAHGTDCVVLLVRIDVVVDDRGDVEECEDNETINKGANGLVVKVVLRLCGGW